MKINKIMAKKVYKKYIVTYLSQEHYEVLGYVVASNMKEAIENTKKELKGEAEYYEVTEANVAELGEQKRIAFETK
jgi:hypothetical protein